MSRLRELQSLIARVSLDGEPTPALLAAVQDDRRIKARERLQSHRNNTMLGLIAPLAANFPVVAELVGEAYFAALARRYIRAHPPRRPDLLLYGSELPDFIAATPSAASVPYLADMARLELAIAIADNARDQAPLAAAALQAFAADQLEQLLLTPHPSLRLVASSFPLLALWQAHQPGGSLDRPIAFDQGDEMLLVYRPRSQTLLRKVTAGEFALVMSLAAGQTLTAACAAGITRDADFSVAGSLADLLAADLFVAASLPCAP